MADYYYLEIVVGKNRKKKKSQMTSVCSVISCNYCFSNFILESFLYLSSFVVSNISLHSFESKITTLMSRCRKKILLQQKLLLLEEMSLNLYGQRLQYIFILRQFAVVNLILANKCLLKQNSYLN